MIGLRFTRARTRLALTGAMLCALFLALLAWTARSIVRATTFEDIDEDLYTLAVALGSSFELEGVEESVRDALKLGLEANLFEFKLANHSVILFLGDKPVAVSGNLLKTNLPGGFEPYRDKPEAPYTAVEPYSGQNRTCRFLVTHLGGRAKGATLVLFRSIEQSHRALRRLDGALLGFVVLGFLGTAGILALVLRRALQPVEEVTRVAEALEPTDLSKRVLVAAGGEEFRRLAAVINSLLERRILILARGDAGSLERREMLDLGDVAEQAMAAAAPLGAPRGVHCTLMRQGAAPVVADRAALLSAASNLVSNALTYTLPRTAVELSAGSRDAEAFLEIADRGPGVPPEERTRIFERFVRLDNARARNPEGSGLGLAIVEQVARSHGGRVEVEAREGGGSVFRFTLPRAEKI